MARRAQAAPASARPCARAIGRFQQPQLRQVHLLAQFVRDLQRFLELGLRGIGIAGQQQRLAPHSRAPRWPRRACRAGCSVRRPRGSGDSLRVADPCAPRPSRGTTGTPSGPAPARTRRRAPASRRPGSRRDRRCPGAPRAVPRARRRSRRVIGWRSSAARARARCACARPCCTRPLRTNSMASIPSSVTCGSATKPPVLRQFERLRDRETALDPGACRLRPALQMLHAGRARRTPPASAPGRPTPTTSASARSATSSACAYSPRRLSR